MTQDAAGSFQIQDLERKVCLLGDYEHILSKYGRFPYHFSKLSYFCAKFLAKSVETLVVPYRCSICRDGLYEIHFNPYPANVKNMVSS